MNNLVLELKRLAAPSLGKNCKLLIAIEGFSFEGVDGLNVVALVGSPALRLVIRDQAAQSGTSEETELQNAVRWALEAYIGNRSTFVNWA